MKKAKATKKKKAVAETAPTDDSAALTRSVFTTAFHSVLKEMELEAGLEYVPRLSTGLLVIDQMHSGGLGFGLTIPVGLEQSAKTTLGLSVMAQAIRAQVPIISVMDAENALHPDYASAILRTMAGLHDIDNFFGVRSETGGWKVPPTINYSDINLIEPIFHTIHKTLSALPDKRFRNTEPFLVFDKTREQQAMMHEMGLKPVQSLSNAKRSWCAAPDSKAQAFFLVDALNALVPEDVDTEEVTGNALALEARVLGRFLRLVRGKMRRKGCVLIGINQIRLNPGARMGNPEYETMGNGPKQFSDIRIKLASRVPPDGFQRDKEASGLCIEPSVTVKGGHDRYAFKGLTNIKNKLGTPYRKGMARVWTSDANGKAYGFDPVYDTYAFLHSIGAIAKVRGKGTFKITFEEGPFRHVKDYAWSWDTFKTLILAESLRTRELRDLVDKHSIPKVQLRKAAFALIESGRSETLYQEAQRSRSSSGEDDE